MEGNAKLGRNLTRLDEEIRSRNPCDTELVLERDQTVDRRYRNTHEQPQVRCPLAVSVRRLLDDLRKLIEAVERKASNAQFIGAPDGATRLDRMHEMKLGS